MKTIGQISMVVKKTVLKKGETKLNPNMNSHFQCSVQTLSLAQKDNVKLGSQRG